MLMRLFSYIYRILFLMSVLLSVSCEQLPAAPKDKGGRLKIVWDTPEMVVAKGGYPRVHRLNDSRLMLSYSLGGHTYARFSNDDGYSWSDQAQRIISGFTEDGKYGKVFVNASNPEFAQLSQTNPHCPGRMIFAVNYRPKDNRSSIYPYTIAISTSDDNGKSWSEARHIYKSERWDKDVVRGCWEPFVLELPDGTVQIYFADETPYYREGASWQNISVIESKDGGETWGNLRVVSQNGPHRDGMPVVTLYDGMLYMAIESSEKDIRLHPIVVCNSLEDNWSETAGRGSEYRFHPFAESLESEEIYSGAPYIIQTENYLVYSYQISDDPDVVHDARHSTLEVQACPKAEIKKNGYFYTMRGASRPLDVDQSKEAALWNSLCDLGNDEILVVSQYRAAVWITRGRIVMK